MLPTMARGFGNWLARDRRRERAAQQFQLFVQSATRSIPDTTPTVSDVPLITFGIIYDGMGQNVITLTGADAAFFKTVGKTLYLKAGTSLNHLVKSSYAVTIGVTNALHVGVSLSKSFTLTVT